jgi:hypothetical protein
MNYTTWIETVELAWKQYSSSDASNNPDQFSFYHYCMYDFKPKNREEWKSKIEWAWRLYDLSADCTFYNYCIKETPKFTKKFDSWNDFLDWAIDKYNHYSSSDDDFIDYCSGLQQRYEIITNITLVDKEGLGTF